MRDTIRVLHVDDDPQFTELTSRFLRKENDNFEIVTETYAEEGLEYLTESEVDVDCIVSDYALPDLDGLEFLEAVRADHPHIPFIFFTGMGSEAVAGDALSQGATDYLQKQGGTEQYGLLANRIQDAVQQHRSEMERTWSERSRKELYEITSETELSIEGKIDQLLELGRERLRVENGHVVRIDSPSDRHEVEHAVGTNLVQEGTVTDLAETFCRHTVETQGVLGIYNAVEEGYGEDPAYQEWDIGCYIGGRIDVGEDLYGTVCFVNQQPREREFTESERTFVVLLTRWLNHMFERQQYEESLRQEKARFELLVGEVSTHAIFMLDPEGYVVSWNQGARNIKGYEEEDIIGEHFSTFYTEEQISERLPDTMLATAEKEGRAEHEGWRVRKDGSRFWASVSITALNDDAGNLRGFGKVTRDLTERREQTKRYENLIEHSTDIITVLDENGTIAYQSPSVENVLGYQQDELVGEEAFEYIHPNDRESVIETFSELIGTPGDVTQTERYRFRRKDGSWGWLESIASNQKAGLLDGYVINSRDVTEQVKRERALRESRELFRSIAESATDAILTIDTDSRILFANQAVERIFGYAPEELIEESLTTLMPDGYQDQHRAAIERYLDTGERSLDWESIEMPGLHKDGHVVELEISFSEFEQDGEKRFAGIIRS